MTVKLQPKNKSYHRMDKLPPLKMDKQAIVNQFRHYLNYTIGRDDSCSAPPCCYEALAATIRERLTERWKNTQKAYQEKDCKRAYYLSLEFLMGRALGNAMLNLGLTDIVKSAMSELGLTLEDLETSELDAGLGNGGLGRLAACFIDSCATLQLPVTGYGLRYEYGMFRQHIENGEQIEEPDHWLRDGCAWELERSEFTQRIRFGGHTNTYVDSNDCSHVRWVDTHDVLAIPYDVPVPGYQNGTVNTLRLWKAEATDIFDLGEFNAGSYPESVAAKNNAEHITMVLYPNDSSENGKDLRLRQQYFLASASLQDVVRSWVEVHGGDFSEFAEKNCFQLNDTHPSIAVAELMRLLVDEHKMGWDGAWKITTKVMAYTNHTLLPEALEKWSVSLFSRLLPRILEIIYEINARFLREVDNRWPGDVDRLARMSLIEEGDQQHVRMAYLAIVGSFSVNGVAQLHTELLKEGLFRDFHELWPSKFNNKTNGITPRRWLAWCNPDLSNLITDAIGEGWVTDIEKLRRLTEFADDSGFQDRWRRVKLKNKERLLEYKKSELGISFDATALFDVQVKRIHEYKRQLLNVLHVIHLYDRVKRGDVGDWVPRCVLIGGKAAPGYWLAKRIIKLINNVANVINRDAGVNDKLKLAFLPNYRVSAMEIICPGADLSEQISTAGKEASGTGNMKFMMNGALTIGTLDGANIEIREEVGEESFFLFGLTAQQVEETKRNYDPVSIIANDDDFARVMQLLECGHFNRFEPDIFNEIIGSIKNPFDPWVVAADFRSYIDAQQSAAKAYQDQENWTRMSILNCAYSGKFSADRTIQEYSNEIWDLKSVAPKELG